MSQNVIGAKPQTQGRCSAAEGPIQSLKPQALENRVQANLLLLVSF